MKKKDIPPRLRRYILMQVEKYRYCEGYLEEADDRNGEEIVHIQRGKKVKGGERRRNSGPSKSRVGG